MLQILIYGLANGAVLALNAISVTVVYGTVRTLNLAHGDVFALTTSLLTTALITLGVQRTWSPPILIGVLVFSLIGTMIIGAGLNVGIERLAFRPFRHRSRLAPLIATLGLSYILFQFAMILRTLQSSWVPHEHRSVPGLNEVPTDSIPNLLPNLDLLPVLNVPTSVTFNFNVLFVVALAVACALGVSLLLTRTRTGRAIRACAQDPATAQLCGVNLDGVIRRAFALGGALSGVAAFAFALYYTRPVGAHGAESGLLAFAAAIVGGIGRPVGALLSGLVIGIVGAFSDYALSAQWTPVLLLALLIGLLLLRPTGLTAEQAVDEPASARDAIILTARSAATRSRFWLGGLLLILALFPIFSALFGWGWQILLRGVGLYTLLTLGLNLLLGLAGVLDLGFAVSFGIGGYAVAILTNRYGVIGSQLPQPIDLPVLLIISGGLAAAFGALKGALALRLRSDYLAVATLALGLMAHHAVLNLRAITGGVGGIAALPPPYVLGRPIENATVQYYLVLACVLIVVAGSQRLSASRLGRAWIAASGDEVAAAAAGVNVAHYKRLAFMLSSAVAGVAGALYASTFAFVAPDLVAFHVSVMTLAMVVLGGAGTVPGAVLGTVLIIGYDQLIVPQIAALIASLRPPDAATYIGAVPDVRGTSFFNFGLALYLTVWWRVRRGRSISNPGGAL